MIQAAHQISMLMAAMSKASAQHTCEHHPLHMWTQTPSQDRIPACSSHLLQLPLGKLVIAAACAQALAMGHQL